MKTCAYITTLVLLVVCFNRFALAETWPHNFGQILGTEVENGDRVYLSKSWVSWNAAYTTDVPESEIPVGFGRIDGNKFVSDTGRIVYFYANTLFLGPSSRSRLDTIPYFGKSVPQKCPQDPCMDVGANVVSTKDLIEKRLTRNSENVVSVEYIIIPKDSKGKVFRQYFTHDGMTVSQVRFASKDGKAAVANSLTFGQKSWRKDPSNLNIIY